MGIQYIQLRHFMGDVIELEFRLDPAWKANTRFHNDDSMLQVAEKLFQLSRLIEKKALEK